MYACVLVSRCVKWEEEGMKFQVFIFLFIIKNVVNPKGADGMAASHSSMPPSAIY